MASQPIQNIPAPNAVLDLIERFERNLGAYKSGSYNETQLRREFLDPFFECLGWDVLNKNGWAENYKDVIHEDAIRIGDMMKAPDYGFRIGGVRKFFVEAKKPAVNLKMDVTPAFQLRRYAWSAKLPLSILTDFEEFAIYDCRIKPKKEDKASTGRVNYLTFRDYPERWGEIAGVFHRDAILQGSFDKYVESKRAKRGTAEVDDAFLESMEAWRFALARNFALRNKELTVRELNYAVQQTLDRIIFLRMCEDRAIEDYGQLLAACNGPNIYVRLKELFRKADAKYNSGLFHFSGEKGRASDPDGLTPHLQIDDRVLKDVIKELYYPESPYVFSQIPPEILGQVYEQFLGKVIYLTPGHQAKVEEKPEVRKAGGVYYTPAYIVDYIVEQTVGKLCEGKSAKQMKGLRIVDPACGSGSFLVAAYEFLLKKHLDWYEKHTPEKKKQVYQGRGGQWFLTSEEKKSILLSSIYGVDIDPQAVEVTKLSLLLKVLEGESKELLDRALLNFRDRALPDLGANIKCGNSLIGSDFYTNQPMSLFDQETLYRINVFDWEQAFPHVFHQSRDRQGAGETAPLTNVRGSENEIGRFDAVIGNPPWGADFDHLQLPYIRDNFATAKSSSVDSYAVFMERGLRRLKPSGLLGFITPDTFLRKDDRIATRRLVFNDFSIRQLIETGPVFSRVRDTWCLVSVICNSLPRKETSIVHRKLSRFIVSAEERLASFGKGDWSDENVVAQSIWKGRPNLIVGYLTSEQDQGLIAKLERHPLLNELSAEYQISRGEEGSKFAIEEDPSGEFFMVLPKDVERFSVAQGVKINAGSLTQTKVQAYYTRPKIWVIRIQKMRWKQRLVCTFDARCNSAGMKTLQIIVSPTNNLTELKYLNAILASKLINYWCINYLADDMNQSYLGKIPIPTDCNKDLIASVVDDLLALHQQVAKAKLPDDKRRLQSQIDATDRQLDKLVYELYGLTDEEIKIVEQYVSQ